MPALGSVVANGFVESQVRGGIVADKNRWARRNATTARISRQTALYIYSVGCFPVSIPRASKGTLVVFAIPAEKCLIPGDLTVSAPAVLEGIPSETYPSEGAPKWIDTAPPPGIGYDDEEGFHLFEEEAGYYEALVTIGAAPLSQPEQDLRPQGLFVSKFPEQKKPTAPTAPKKDAGARESVAYERAKEEYDAALALFHKWEDQVVAAQERFTQYCRDTVQSGNEALAAGLWSKIKAGPGKGEPFITCARLLHYTEVEAPFLKDSVEVAQRVRCISCNTTLLAGSLKCAGCGEKQVSDEVFETEMKKRRAVNG
jgi:hypothetical protein